MLKLRALEPEDLTLLFEVENRREEWNVGNTNVPFSRYALREYILNNAYDIYADKQLRQAVENKEGNVVGFVDLANFEPRHQRAEVSIVISPAYRNRGYAQQAMRELVSYAHDFLSLHQLYAIVPVSNQPSHGFLKAVGFTPTATLKDWVKCTSGMEDAIIYQLFLKKE